MNILEELNLEQESLTWEKLALCNGLDPAAFFELYENNDDVAMSTDSLCLSCPVMKQCLLFGTQNKESGVWGGVHLNKGEKTKHNSHKTKEVWDMIYDKVQSDSSRDF